MTEVCAVRVLRVFMLCWFSQFCIKNKKLWRNRENNNTGDIWLGYNNIFKFSILWMFPYFILFTVADRRAGVCLHDAGRPCRAARGHPAADQCGRCPQHSTADAGWKHSHSTKCHRCPKVCCKADSRFAPSQWETLLQSNAVSHWLGANLESALMLPESSQCSKFILKSIWPSSEIILIIIISWKKNPMEIAGTYESVASKKFISLSETWVPKEVKFVKKWLNKMWWPHWWPWCKRYYQTSNISCTWIGFTFVDHSDVVGVSPVDAAPTTSSFLT